MADLIIGAVLKGGMYILISMGLTLVYGVMRISNFAHGEFYMIGAYVAYLCAAVLKLPSLLSILVAALTGFAVGVILERICFYPLRKRSQKDWGLNTFLVTAGISFILQYGVQYFVGANYYGVKELFPGSVRIANVSVPMDRIVAFIIAIGTMLVFWMFLKKSKTGSAIRAVSEHEIGAMLMGVNLNQIQSLTLGLSSMLAALAGAALLAITPASPMMGQKPLYAAWFVVILVGLGNLEATIIGSFMVAFIESFANFYVGAVWQDAISLSVIVLILIFKPNGLFGKKAKV